MGDEPRFPPPDETKAQRSPETSSVPTQPARPVIVRRAEPIVEDAPDENKKAPVKLTSDEMRALLAVEGVNRPGVGKTLWRRGRIIIIPTGLIQLAAYLLLGSAAPFIDVGIAIAAIVWCALPLFKKDEWA